MSDDFNIFLSWSGDQSRWVADALRRWLPVVLQTAKPWMSSANIDIGSRSLSEISARLNGMKIGIVCLTPENLEAPWILYEAGALSKEIGEKSRLCTYLLAGLEFQDIKGPLGMFQATKPDKQGTRDMIFTINRTLGHAPVPDANLDRLIDAMWPQFEGDLKKMPTSQQPPLAKREVGDMVSEILQIARAEADTVKSMRAQITHVEETLYRAPFGDGGIIISSAFTPRSPLSSAGYLTSPLVFGSDVITADGAIVASPSEVPNNEERQSFRVVSHSDKDSKTK
jgi:hypothetical protein